MTGKIETLINQLEDLESVEELEKMRLDDKKNQLIDSVLTPEIRKQVSDIEAEFTPLYEAIGKGAQAEARQEKINALKKQITKEVIAFKDSVRGTTKMAVFYKGKPELTEKKIVVEEHILVELTTMYPEVHKCWRYETVVTQELVAPKVVFKKIGG